ncbi:MAG: hypothetical protein A3B91_00025 [Candidatus Yanofskybacteria bacterium RIFCSPHIGHO2_02_FULL_41_29]|uniref:Uncharacterized protein n=1 Tax=Candidatus Yanofskybacteria bacterium RIFCSPHIGHO2_01_FULL_41_53 TaxID=1802663 RepID=A0A1F8EN85_9BACT|nr:MAG: hypothetical protein A2650_02685 [Candidatus Yanofskybacteria bacterium RIFCSPHIGHO2_01_FULL_41_53]OGN10413.1 MAG: hypothetical protein A3B91_00025 [Candidatus Yanofskybacteria bacterium RIFCSPHIGHO2_02_FULL_41_29]OGN18407.1 MAG: hypothetical protein A3F48_01030 [Candidatus Yanofskybacteria bacterium RIFCSPHIGHO2_12_FULL_41_9]OGN21156.1 MAG: hypothetical protein A2916_02060 [Candidatus Yanofskybacteria bacterium RIFCSPLOWO2_01_FULL_41_67]OGN30070.1 MAG: hypothetical protein A3H54_02540 
MIRGEYKKILWEMFDALGFFESEREKALEGFKKKFASQLLMEIRDCMSDEQREWIVKVATSKQYNKNDPKVAELQKVIDSFYPKEKMDEVSRKVFKKILESYVSFMSQKVDSEKSEKLNKILNNL